MFTEMMNGRLLTPPPPLQLKQEPLSVVFVGPDLENRDASSNFIKNANSTTSLHLFNSTNNLNYIQQQQPNEHWIDQNIVVNKQKQQQYEQHEQQYFELQTNYINNNEQMFEREEYNEEDFSTVPTIVSSSSPSFSAFEPLSVCSSTWSSSIGGERGDYSSSSQDEIFEEIQRECDEIERRSFSRSPPEQQNNEKINKKLRASKASLPRAERKKELNRFAATRYREKKKKEREETFGEMEKLESRNLILKSEIAAVQAEINYLKGLVKEINAVRRTAINVN